METPTVPPAVASTGEVDLTLSVLAALLAAPADPAPTGSTVAIRAALAGPLRRLLAAEEPGWRLPRVRPSGGSPATR